MNIYKKSILTRELIKERESKRKCRICEKDLKSNQMKTCSRECAIKNMIEYKLLLMQELREKTSKK